MITAALETVPPTTGAWTCRSLARLLGVSPATISRVWRAPTTEPTAPGRVRLQQGRQALERHLCEAYELLAAADATESLGPDEIESLAIAAGWSGQLDDPQKVAALDDDLARLAERHLADGTTMDWEYLIITARKR